MRLFIVALAHLCADAEVQGQDAAYERREVPRASKGAVVVRRCRKVRKVYYYTKVSS